MASISQPQSFLKKVGTSRFFVIALIIHAVFVALFGGKVLFNKYMEKPDFAADAGTFLKGTTEDAAPPAPPAPPAPQLAPSVPTMPTMSTITANSPAVTDFTLPTTPVVPPTMSNTLAEQPTVVPTITSPTAQQLGALPATMGARGSGRAEAISKAGGKQASELAVINSLRWLQKVQNPDGTWGQKFQGAMTGLALLCYLGHGETPQASKEFGIVVTNAINALVAGGTKGNGVLTLRGTTIDQAGCYEHAIATYALCEAYTMTKDERLAPLVQQAVGYILNGQGPDGGWMYGYSKAVPSDTSVTGWQVQALKAAHLTGLPIAGIPDALDNAMKDLDRVYDPNSGSYGYRVPGPRPTLTGVGVLCKIFWQGRLDPKIRDATMKSILKGAPVDYTSPKANLYAWYYHTQACFMVGGGSWAQWNRMFQDQIIDHQSPDGSWPVMDKATGGLSILDTIDGQAYRTCFCTLMLEVYYRYLPTGKGGERGDSAQQ